MEQRTICTWRRRGAQQYTRQTQEGSPGNMLSHPPAEVPSWYAGSCSTHSQHLTSPSMDPTALEHLNLGWGAGWSEGRLCSKEGVFYNGATWCHLAWTDWQLSLVGRTGLRTAIMASYSFSIRGCLYHTSKSNMSWSCSMRKVSFTAHDCSS